MSNRFDAFIPFILKWECDYPEDMSGQYSNDPDDPGGETKFGIDKRSHPLVDISSLTYDGAILIYQQEWDLEAIESLQNKLGEAHFDTCVNVGQSRAITFLNQARNDPGIYISLRESFYRRLCDVWKQEGKANPDKFLAGWLNRTTDLRQFIAA